MANQVLADRIRGWRAAARLSLEDLGGVLGVSRQTVWRWEHGATVSATQLAGILHACRVDEEEWRLALHAALPDERVEEIRAALEGMR